MTTNKGRGRSRKASPIRRLTDGMKKAIVYLVCVSLIGTSMLSSSVFADVDESSFDPGDVIVYLDNDGSVETASNAVRPGGSGGGSGNSAVSNSIITIDEVESAANALKTSDTVTYQESAGGVIVTVEAPEGALPEGAELIVERYMTGSDEFAEATEAIGHEADDENMAAVDIHFELDGEEVEPSKEVTVSIDVSNILPEEADPASIVVTHLEEIESEEDNAEEDEESGIAELSLEKAKKEVKPVVVVNRKKGEIDKENAVAKFKVKSFSVFTVTWDDDTGTTIEVHVYSVSGTSIDEELDVESYTSTSSVITISDLISHLEQNAAYTNTYTYRYATVVYETQMGGGYSATTIGGEDNSVASISKSGTTYTVTTSSGTTTVTDPAAIVIHLYYSIPTVTLETEDPYGETVEFTTSNNYFVGDTSSATYTWALSDDNLGTLVHPTSGQATFTWSDSAQSGDQVTVTVTMTVGDETASDTYTLTYGDDPVTFTVYSQDGTTPQENARVALVDASGNTVATGTTGDDGTVTLYAPAGEYTVGVTYVYLVSEIGGSTSRATAETTITVSDDETVTGSVTLGTAVTSGPGGNTSGSNGGGSEPYYYEHIDVKVAAAQTEDSDVSFSDLDAVYVYDKYGNLLYVSEDINANPDTTDYNVLFDINANEDQHSIVVSSEDTIVLVYEVKNNETGESSTYTVSYRSGGTYPENEYYQYTDVNAWQLYSNLYNDWSYSGDTDSDEGRSEAQAAFEEAWEAGTLQGYNEAGISISGYSYTLIADYLCDTRTTTGQAGLDFVIYVQELEVAQHDFDFRVAKTVEDVPANYTSEDIENFTFTLQELDKVQDDGDWTEAIWSTEEGNVLSTDTDTISSFTQNSDGIWSGVLDFLGALEYEAEDGTNFYYYILSEQTPTTATPTQQYYGLKVTVTYTAATGVATVVVSYCTLGTQDDYPYYRTSGWTGLTAYTDTDDEGEEYTYYSIPFVNTYSTTVFKLEKVDDSGNALDGAVFTMTTTQIEGEGTTLYFTSSTDDEGKTVYSLASSATESASAEITITNGGPVSIQGMAAGTYTLTETTTPDGYATVDTFTVTITDEGTVTVSENTNVRTEPSEPEEPDEDEPSEEEPGEEEPDSETIYIVTVTNNEIIDLSGSKIWINDVESERPESITIYLYADGVEQVESDNNAVKTTATADNNWEWSFTGLPRYQSDGKTEIVYTVLEGEITDSSYLPTYDTDEDGKISITNAIPEVHKDVSDPAYGESTDDDLHQDEADNNDTLEYKMEADHIGGAHDLVLHDFLSDQLDMTTLEIQSVTLYTDEDDEGTALVESIDYIVSYGECSAECGLDGCSFEIHVFDEDVENLSADAYVIVIFDIDVKEDVGDFDDNYVDEIDNFVGLSFTAFSVRQYAEPDETETYSYGFDIYKYDSETDEPLEGVEFVLSKNGDDGTVYAQFDVSDNTYLLTGWVDGKDDATPIVTGSDGNAVVEGLHDGIFSIEETKALEGYQQIVGKMTVTITVDEDDPSNPTIIASNANYADGKVQISNPPSDGETIEIIGSKTWDDSNDEKGIRPGSIIIHLFADEEEVASVTVTADDGWAWSFKEMPKYQDDGTTEIVYTITEDAVEGYDTEISGYDVTNTYTTETETPTPPDEPGQGSGKYVDIDGDGDFNDDGQLVSVGDMVTYEITYVNTEGNEATITVTDHLDDGLDLVSVANGGTYDSSTRTITWIIENVAPGEGGSVLFTAQVNENARTEDLITNTATIKIGNGESKDTNTVENSVHASKSVSTDGGEDFDGNDKDVTLGEELIYKITYKNTGESAATVYITDVLEAGMTYVESSANCGGTYDKETRTLSWTIENVQPDEEGSVEFKATVNSTGRSNHSVSNTATVTVNGSDYHTNTTNNPVPSTSTTSSSGGGYSGSGSSHSNSSTSGPGAESTAHESSGGGNSVNTDNIGGLPQTGEGSMAMILISVCVVLAAVLAVLFHIRRRTTKDRE